MDKENFVINNNDRIAQGVVAFVTAKNYINLINIPEITDSTERGEGGHGSTGK